jgi:hypothetical protein
MIVAFSSTHDSQGAARLANQVATRLVEWGYATLLVDWNFTDEVSPDGGGLAALGRVSQL